MIETLNIIVNIIIFEIHIWHFVLQISFFIFTKKLMRIYEFIECYICKIPFDHCFNNAYIIWINKIK
jgi:hypothetical protein